LNLDVEFDQITQVPIPSQMRFPSGPHRNTAHQFKFRTIQGGICHLFFLYPLENQLPVETHIDPCNIKNLKESVCNKFFGIQT
jgi:hypothetical protein